MQVSALALIQATVEPGALYVHKIIDGYLDCMLASGYVEPLPGEDVENDDYLDRAGFTLADIPGGPKAEIAREITAWVKKYRREIQSVIGLPRNYGAGARHYTAFEVGVDLYRFCEACGDEAVFEDATSGNPAGRALDETFGAHSSMHLVAHWVATAQRRGGRLKVVKA